VKQAILIVLDSVGVGYAPDAAAFGDEGSNTLGHIREAVRGFAIPNLDRAGLRAAEMLASGDDASAGLSLSWGCMTELSAGKDTTAGHWEIAGAPVSVPFATFEKFPESLVSEMETAAGVTFIGNYPQSGTVILDELGKEHLQTGNPILYTSADSVIQIAAHEDILPVDRLYQICRACREIADRERIGRVIARPFAGNPGEFVRTAGRHDFSLQPSSTILDLLQDHGVESIGVGKIADIFAGAGIDSSFPTTSNQDGCETIDRLLAKKCESPRLIFVNLVDFDMLYGHRRDPSGYARALEEFDEWFGTLIGRLSHETLLAVTADHGNDPTWTGTDHTRERVPLLVYDGGPSRCLGARETFADVAASLADWFGVSQADLPGTSFL